ncbi:uncharacterized protein PV07_12530 [Cladophialophora immunda]|uniref:BTB domain-containing protein n=1 Tax=Cladophialophora immunda TaxID=569365 RepID=A0A0D2ABD9_9EURO|nr:uncharacterized protein PV07_12530 [Cladophialophora immunda]KIW22067.1 hypothetical protein PV07_12530 [Cladophialophora immunda]
MPGPATPPLPERLSLTLPDFKDVATVKLLVGGDKSSFLVHRPLLEISAPFFTSALESQFKEGNEQLITFPEDDPATVLCFVQWVYYKSYNLPDSGDERFILLAKLYIFADKVLSDPLKNDVIRMLFYLRSQGVDPPQLPVVRFAFDNMPPHFPFRKLLVDWYGWHIDLAWLEEPSTMESLAQHPEFTAELASRLAKRVTSNMESPLLETPEPYLAKATQSDGRVPRPDPHDDGDHVSI